MRNEPCMHVELVRRHFNVLNEKGVPENVLEDALGCSKKDLTDDDLRIPLRNGMKMLRKGAELLGPDMGIKLGALAKPEIIGVLGQIMKNCRNLGEAAYQFVRFQNLYFSIARFKIAAEGRYGKIVHTIDYPLSEEDKRLITELNLSICLASARKLSGVEFVPQEVRFSYKRPQYADAYQLWFRCPIKFDQKEDAMVIDSRLGQMVIPGAYADVKNILADHTERCLARLQAGKQFQEQVRRIVVGLFPKGMVDINMVSAELNMSRWTLTRNLKKEGMTFKGLLTALRRELAADYLEDRQLTIIEIAFLLGYSEASAFQRAFKNWTGKNPGEYRRCEKRGA